MKPTELVVLSTFRSVADAQIAKGILDEAEIESTIRSDNAGGMYPALDFADLLVILNFHVPLLKDGIARIVNQGRGPILQA